MDGIIISKMNDYLYKAAKSLALWLGDMLPKSGEDWWDECVIGNLKFNQRELALRNKYSKLADFDLAALLRIADKSWYTMRGYAFLPISERECLRDVMGVRNNWAHCSAELPGKDMILFDIKTLSRFFLQMGCDDYVMALDEFYREVESPVSAMSAVTLKEPKREEKQASAGSILEKSLVYIVGSPDIKGMVFSVSALGNTKKYEVFVDGSLKTYYEGQIAPVDDFPEYEWVDTDTLRSYLSAYQINNPSSGNLYSLNSARIDFVPYQFRPALKLIKSGRAEDSGRG